VFPQRRRDLTIMFFAAAATPFNHDGFLAANADLESGMVAEGLAQSLLIGTEEHKHAVEEARWRR